MYYFGIFAQFLPFVSVKKTVEEIAPVYEIIFLCIVGICEIALVIRSNPFMASSNQILITLKLNPKQFDNKTPVNDQQLKPGSLVGF